LLITTFEGSDKRLLDLLFIEFQAVRIHINSLAVQAVIDRSFSHGNRFTVPAERIMSVVFERSSVDYEFIQMVVDGSRKLLRTVLSISKDGILVYCPVRVFSRTVSASILLLKVS
jgi:hypothetical protein